jgi:hypothetical protein
MKYLHPLLFAIYPILYLYSENFVKMPFGLVQLPIVVAVVGVFVVAGIFWGISRSLSSAALFASSVVIGCASFRGGVFLLKKLSGESLAVREQAMLCLLVLVWILIGSLLLRFRRLPGLNIFLSVVATALVVMNFVGIAPMLFAASKEPHFCLGTELQEVSTRKIRKQKEHPDIFYIVLDAFGRDDVLQEMYGVDSAEFIAGLEARGFYVARESRSNYCQTSLSLGATLNISYLDSVARRLQHKKAIERLALRNVVRKNQLMRFLREVGYEVDTYSSGYSGAEFSGVDRDFKPFFVLSEFDQLVLTQSPIPAILNLSPVQGINNLQFESHRKRVRYTLRHLGEEQGKRARKPRFVFAHVLSPHPPFLFDRDGNAVTPAGEYRIWDGSHYRGTHAEYQAGYRGQVEFMQRAILNTLDRIIENHPEAVIVLQGDHGPGMHLNWSSFERTNLKERFGILNAYRVSDRLKEKLYPTITPVNSFRLILNEYFGMDLAVLEDKSFYSEWKRPFKFFAVPGVVSPRSSAAPS